VDVVATKDVEQIPTPQTPRHRDALSKRVPVTPRHRFTVPVKPLLTPRTPRTPRTPSTPSNCGPTIYAGARQLFTRSANSGELIGRETERAELHAFVQSRIQSKKGGCIYVSGPPGTGKSAFVNDVVSEVQRETGTEAVTINCMSMESAQDVFSRLTEELVGDAYQGEAEVKHLEGLFLSKDHKATTYIITLDEMDHLLTLDLELLYSLFEWSTKKSSRLVLIGIANALDLTDRFLPRLKAKNIKPQLLPFLPYSATEIASVITSCLKSLLPDEEGATTPGYVPFLHPAAIQLCSRKVASQTGDLRKAFDICRRAVDLIESETKQKHSKQLSEQTLLMSPSKGALVENVNLSSSPFAEPISQLKASTLTESLAKLTATTAPRATIAHLARITSAAFSNGSSERLKTLNLQQKAALCALVAVETSRRQAFSVAMSKDPFNPSTPTKSKHTGSPTVKALFEIYTGLCKRDGKLHPLTSTDFRDVIDSLETLSLVTIFEAKAGGKGFDFLGADQSTSRKYQKKGGFGATMLDERNVSARVGCNELEDAVDSAGAGGAILKALLRGDGL
jgi:cell division control protein 6